MFVHYDETITPNALVTEKWQARGYWVLRVPKQIINGHGGIFNENSIDFIAGLYKICRAEIQQNRAVKLESIAAE